MDHTFRHPSFPSFDRPLHSGIDSTVEWMADSLASIARGERREGCSIAKRRREKKRREKEGIAGYKDEGCIKTVVAKG